MHVSVARKTLLDEKQTLILDYVKVEAGYVKEKSSLHLHSLEVATA